MPSLRTPLCDRFGIDHLIVSAPTGGGDAPGSLAAAVSETGVSDAYRARTVTASAGDAVLTDADRPRVGR